MNSANFVGILRQAQDKTLISVTQNVTEIAYKGFAWTSPGSLPRNRAKARHLGSHLRARGRSDGGFQTHISSRSHSDNPFTSPPAKFGLVRGFPLCPSAPECMIFKVLGAKRTIPTQVSWEKVPEEQIRYRVKR